MRSRLRRAAGAPSMNFSCERLVRIHQHLRTRTRSAHQRGRLGEQYREVEARGLQLALIERIGVSVRYLAQCGLRHARPEVAEHQVPRDAQVIHSRGPDFVRVLESLEANLG